jgi:probable F420-dependent oxidoreductase
LRIGIANINAYKYSYPEVILDAASRAENAGLESIWTIEHIALPDPRVDPSPMDPTSRILDPLVTLAFLAARTQTVRLCTGILILPLRNPVILARQIASLDVLSKGRVTLGVGVGYVEPEFDAVGVLFGERGRRADEYISAMRALWHGERPAIRGEFVSFANVQSYPHPVQTPSIPIIVGGSSMAAYERAMRVANGWYGYGLTTDEAKTRIAGLARAAELVNRPEGLGPLTITVTPSGQISSRELATFAELGVDRLNLLLPEEPTARDLDHFFTAAEALVRASA